MTDHTGCGREPSAEEILIAASIGPMISSMPSIADPNVVEWIVSGPLNEPETLSDLELLRCLSELRRKLENTAISNGSVRAAPPGKARETVLNSDYASVEQVLNEWSLPAAPRPNDMRPRLLAWLVAVRRSISAQQGSGRS